jgi:ribonuclease Z
MYTISKFISRAILSSCAILSAEYAFDKESLSANATPEMGMFTLGTPKVEGLTDGKLHLYFCGTGDPEIGMQNIRRPSCLAVVADNEFFVIDAGEGSSQNLGAIQLPLPLLNKVFMTHWHSDHMAGLGYLSNVSWLAGRAGPMNLYGPFGVDKIANALNDLYSLDTLYRGVNREGSVNVDSFVIKPNYITTANGREPIFKTNNLKLIPFQVDHEPAFPALGYVIDYKGCKVVVSGDTSINANLAEHYKDAVLLISEAFSHNLGQYILKSFENSSDKAEGLAYYNETAHYHSDTWELAKFATEQGVKQIVLTHLVPAIPTTKAAKALFTKGMEQYYKGSITVADDRDEVVVEKKGNACVVTYNPAFQPDYKVIQTVPTN